MNTVPKTRFPKLLCLLAIMAVTAVTTPANALSVDRAKSIYVETGEIRPENDTSQGGGMSLSQAVDSVRRRGNVERVISADTRVSGGREVHYIKVLTKDGKVRTHKVNGRKR